MTTILDYFGAAYLINLPERTDKLASAKTEMERIGWNIGPEGVQPYPAQRFLDRAGFPSAGIRGCFNSHRECLRLAHLAGRKSVLILEDDIALSPSFPRLVSSILFKLANTSWDFLYLGHERTGDIGKAGSNTAEVMFVPLAPTNEILTAHFYAVNGRILPRLLEHLDRAASGIEGDQEFGPMPIDGAYNIFRRKNPDVRTLIANPKLGWQRSFRSDISPRPFDKFRSLQPLTDVLRNIKYAAIRWR